MTFFYSTLRSRLSQADGGSIDSASLAFGAGIAGVVCTFIAIVIFVSPILVADDAGRLDPNLYRITQDIGYPIWVMGTMMGALVTWATAAVVLRTGVLPKWFGWFSIVVGAFCVIAIFFIPIFIYFIWLIVAGVLLTLRPASGSAASR